MKIYTYDAGWRGSIAIVAENREEAFDLYSKDDNPFFTIKDMSKLKEDELTESRIVLLTVGDS